MFIEPDKCILQPANATHEPRSDRIRVHTITCSKCLSQASLQSQLPHMPGNFPRCFRREAIVLFPTMLNLRRNPQKKGKNQQCSFARNLFHTARLQIIVILPRRVVLQSKHCNTLFLTVISSAVTVLGSRPKISMISMAAW